MDDIISAFAKHCSLISKHRTVMQTKYNPANIREVEEAEDLLGFTLPILLRRIYLEVENGGYGPGYGLAGVGNGAPLEDDMMVDRCLSWRDPPPGYEYWKWPRGYLPICHWGCAIYSVIDCNLPSAPIYRFDAGEYRAEKRLEDVISLERDSFGMWITDWINGALRS